MIPSASTISGIIADEAAIGMVNQKTTAVRVIPVEGKGVGEMANFGGLMGYAPIIPVNQTSCEEQSSALTFYGSSFITDATGEVKEEMDRVSEGFILHTFDLDEIEEERRSWGLFRDRRPEIYLKE